MVSYTYGIQNKGLKELSQDLSMPYFYPSSSIVYSCQKTSKHHIKREKAEHPPYTSECL